MYPPNYEDLEIALAFGEADLGAPPGNVYNPTFEPVLVLPGTSDELPLTGEPTPEWVQQQGTISPGGVPGPYGVLPEGFGWPGAVAIRPGRWDLDSQSYRVAVGDTLAGLSATYLGSPGRLMEIWMLQSGERRAKSSADILYPDEWLAMPADAVATLYAAVGLPIVGGGTPAPPPPGGYAALPAPPGSSVATAQKAAANKNLLLVGGGIAAAGLLVWALS